MLSLALLFPIISTVTALFKRYETVEDAALIARELLSATAIGTMATTYPQDDPILSGRPFSLQEYYASCYTNGSLLLLFLPISRHSRNILASPDHAASISVWQSPNPSAGQPRVSLIGNVTVIHEGDVINRGMRECYLKAHPDAIRWLPKEPDSPHFSFWARFDPMSVYFVGGFGDEHYIGNIPLHLYQAVNPPNKYINLEGRLRIQTP